MKKSARHLGSLKIWSRKRSVADFGVQSYNFFSFGQHFSLTCFSFVSKTNNNGPFYAKPAFECLFEQPKRTCYIPEREIIGGAYSTFCRKKDWISVLFA